MTGHTVYRLTSRVVPAAYPHSNSHRRLWWDTLSPYGRVNDRLLLPHRYLLPHAADWVDLSDRILEVYADREPAPYRDELLFGGTDTPLRFPCVLTGRPFLYVRVWPYLVPVPLPPTAPGLPAARLSRWVIRAVTPRAV